MLLYFSLTLFVSALLLFLVQPMIGKMILPQLGGTPAVWNTCMVFFQGVLLVGYGYTHLLTTTQSTKRQVLIQGGLLFLPFIVLPFSLGSWVPETEGNPIFSLLFKLTIMVGLPFFMVSTTAPLLQKWFFHTGHPAAKDPYFLYGASNFGSMLGLAFYPTVLEPWLSVTPPEGESTWRTQVHLWTVGYAIFVGLVIGCAYIVWQALQSKWATAAETAAPAAAAQPAKPTAVPATAIASSGKRRGARISVAPTPATTAAPSTAPPAQSVALGEPDDNITLLRRLRWIGLAAAPSSLMLGVTSHLTTDIAAIAFFWIIPLMLYLFTFILVFARWPTVWTGTPHMVVMFIQPCLILFLVLKMIAGLKGPDGYEMQMEFALHLGAFFSTTLMCHGELAKDRPSTKHLTEFYFWMSLGGVLGGLFNALFAPIVFQYGLWEYMIAMAFACLMRSNLVEDIKTLIPGDATAVRPTPLGYVLDYSVPVVVGIAGYYFTYFGDFYGGRPFFTNRYILLGASLLCLVVGIGIYYSVNADRNKKLDLDSLKRLFYSKENPGSIIAWGVAALGVVALVGVNPQFEFTWFIKKAYFLAVLVVFVLALSLRPVRFGLSIAALFVAMTVYERVYDRLLYEGRGFFGFMRVRENKGGWEPMPELYPRHEVPSEWKVYRTLIHGGINHGRQIVEYKDDRAVMPAMWMGVFGSMSAPFGHAPMAGSLVLFSESVDSEGRRVAPRFELAFENHELMMRKRREPITYFHERNGVAELFYKLTWPNAQPVSEIANMNGAADARLPASMVGLGGGDLAALSMLANSHSEPPYAVLGLGTGILACYGKPYQHVDIYEIDPLVKNLSMVPGYVPKWHPDRAKMPKLDDPVFYFVQDAQDRGAKIDVILGDGRLKVKQNQNIEGYYHVIALDAFSSDAIPVHLLTKDAVQLYLDKLADGGVLIFNTTNRYVRIEGVLAAIARDLDLDCLYCSDFTFGSDHPDRFSADWVVLQRKSVNGAYKNGGRPIGERLQAKRPRVGWDGRPIRNSDGEAINDKRWVEVQPLPGPAWTDGYSNMLNPRVMPWLNPWKGN